MTVLLAGATHAGLVRQRNEDSVGALSPQGDVDLIVGTTHRLDVPALVVIADGLGGHSGGDQASGLTVDTILSASPIDADSLIHAIHGANEAIVNAMQDNLDNVGMGSTVAVVLVTEKSLITANVGDTTIWEIIDNRLIELSTDDSKSTRSRLPGIPSSVVTQSLGGGRSLVQVDPHLFEDELRTSRRILVCTDGLTNFVDRPDLAQALGHEAVSDAVSALIDRALDAGAPDNVTVAVLDVVVGDLH